ncbi:hypothetical protein L1887_00908 [Cichorium endivia]|nr:hypothetical protein L1887_00908 [Cichorium endivia]
MEEESASINLLKVDIHYNEFLTPKPLTYLGGVRVSVRDVDFGLFFLRKFKEFLGKLCKTRCDNMYYCTRHETLAEGIRRFGNDADYVEFLEMGYEDENEFRMNVYIDHQNEPVLDWAHMEVPDEEVEDAEDEDDDKDSEKSYTVEYEHVADQEVHSFDKTTDDKFLNKLVRHSNIKSEVNKDDEPNTEDAQGVVFPVHDENQEWDTMVPILGMKFSNPIELKNCVTNYAVKNGYDLWYEKTDCNRLLVKCGKGKKDKNGKSCPFRLWATWMGSVRPIFKLRCFIR